MDQHAQGDRVPRRKEAPVISILVTLVIAGVVLYLLNTLVPMDGRFKTAINVLVGLFLFLWIRRCLWR